MKRLVIAAVVGALLHGPAFAGSSTISVKDAGGSTITFGATTDGSTNLYSNFAIVDGSAAANKAGVTARGALQIEGVASGTAIPVSAASLPLPTGASTSAKQPALGTAGSASTDVLTIQGAASMTKLLVTADPITGTVTANAGTNLNTSALALESGGNLATIAGSIVSGGTALGSIKNSLTGGSVTTAAPTYTTGQIDPLSLNTSGGLRVDGSGVTQPVSAASLPLPTGAATSAIQTGGSQKTQIVDGSGNVIASTSNNLNVQCANCSGSGVSAADEASFTAGASVFASGGGFFQTTATSNPLTTGQQGAFQLTANRALFTNLRNAAGTEVGTSSTPLQVSLANTAGNATAVKVDGSAVTQPVSISGNQAVNEAQINGVTPLMGNGVSGTGSQRVNIASDNTAFSVNANAGTNLNTSALALESGGNLATIAGNIVSQGTALGAIKNELMGASVTTASPTYTTGQINPLSMDTSGSLRVNVVTGGTSGTVAQGSTTSGQSGMMIQGAVTTAAPSYTTAQTSPLSLNTSGQLRVSVEAITNSTGAATGASVPSNAGYAGVRATTSEPTAVSDGQLAGVMADVRGAQVMLLGAVPQNYVSGLISSAMTGTTSTQLLAAPAAGLRNYVTTLVCSNSHATVSTDVDIKDGNAGTSIFTIPAAAVYGGTAISFPVPLKQPTTATRLDAADVTTGANVRCAAVGYKGA
jgi:hypothetical protein